MARNKREKVQDRLRSELDKGKNFYDKKKLTTVICLCGIAMALPLPYLVQIPLLIYFGVSIKNSKLDISAEKWLKSLDKYAVVIWTVITVAYVVLYSIDLIKYWYCTFEAFSRLHDQFADISWLVPTCFRYAIIQAEAFNEFTNALNRDVLWCSETWKIYGEYEFIAFSPRYIDTNSETYISFTDLVSPLSIFIRLNKIDSLIVTTCTAWVLMVSRIYFHFKNRKPKHKI